MKQVELEADAASADCVAIKRARPRGEARSRLYSAPCAELGRARTPMRASRMGPFRCVHGLVERPQKRRTASQDPVLTSRPNRLKIREK